jgi:DeoR family transcriptional regulator, fructose operon transcriptional repressor
MVPVQRQQAILDLLDKKHALQVTDLVALFDVSEMTVRRDLDMLERKGLLRRVHGGAVSNRGRSYEPPFMLRSSANKEAKERIGRAAAALVQNGDSIMLDVGTTTREIARNLKDRQNLTVITPCFQIAALLVENPDIRLILTGGILRHGELSLVGHLAERAIQDFFVDKLFLGVGGVDLKAGFTEFNLEDTLVKQAMLRQAKDITVVADASKFGHVAFTAIASLQAVNRIIGDTGIPADTAQEIEALGLELVFA